MYTRLLPVGYQMGGDKSTLRHQFSQHDTLLNMPETAQVSDLGLPLQECPRCKEIIGAMPGGRDAMCYNCGFKDPCCE